MGFSSQGLRCVRASGVDEFHFDFRWFEAVDDARGMIDEGKLGGLGNDVSPLGQLARRGLFDNGKVVGDLGHRALSNHASTEQKGQ